ncbi:hypothetical protein E4U32_001937 [Claviceps aff. humidiphila group G2b]|nr:hypothetical protein E4U32_001937 [Claviceps aff. humidiphila group G2b]
MLTDMSLSDSQARDLGLERHCDRVCVDAMDWSLANLQVKSSQFVIRRRQPFKKSEDETEKQGRRRCRFPMKKAKLKKMNHKKTTVDEENDQDADGRL